MRACASVSGNRFTSVLPAAKEKRISVWLCHMHSKLSCQHMRNSTAKTVELSYLPCLFDICLCCYAQSIRTQSETMWNRKSSRYLPLTGGYRILYTAFIRKYIFSLSAFVWYHSLKLVVLWYFLSWPVHRFKCPTALERNLSLSFLENFPNFSYQRFFLFLAVSLTDNAVYNIQLVLSKIQQPLPSSREVNLYPL